jgi:hypothetical protein
LNRRNRRNWCTDRLGCSDETQFLVTDVPEPATFDWIVTRGGVETSEVEIQLQIKAIEEMKVCDNEKFLRLNFVK